MAQTDFAFSNDIRAAVELRTPKTARMLLFSSLGLFFVFLVWAHFAVLDEVKRGNGRVVPSRQTQVVQSLEGGIIADLLVMEGAIVEKDCRWRGSRTPILPRNSAKSASAVARWRRA
ncbi:MAG: hypothetical protein MZV49_21850 [Rhodopseudomonas palustris]|nr:hypothetical protein [Rhodopseudomonas palustris]